MMVDFDQQKRHEDFQADVARESELGDRANIAVDRGRRNADLHGEFKTKLSRALTGQSAGKTTASVGSRPNGQKYRTYFDRHTADRFEISDRHNRVSKLDLKVLS